MQNDKKKLLIDIINCLENIDNYLGKSKKFSDYNDSLMLQDAVERNLITIGEAMSILLKQDSQIPISFARRIVDTRNRLTHGYDEIDNTQIWNIIINHLPLLRKEVSELLNS